MKPFFKPIPLILFGFSLWITGVCASLLSWDQNGNLFVHSYSVWGDWSAHFSFISAFLERGTSWIKESNPVFWGMPFQYPFLSHLITALIAKITPFDLIDATYFSSLLLIFALPTLLFRLMRQIGLSAFASLASILTFLLIGGFQWMDSGLNPGEPLTNQFQNGSVFTQFILFELFPQRAFLFGMIALSLLLTAFFKRKVWTPRSIAFFALAFSLLAWLHIHTWIAMSSFLLFLFLFPMKSGPSRKQTLSLGLVTLILSTIFLSFLLLRDSGGPFKGTWDWWLPGWAQNDKAHLQNASAMNFYLFWIYNTGFFIPLSILGIVLLREQKEWRALFFTGAFLFSMALTLNLQPYFYDNLKTFTYAFFFLAPFVGVALEAIKNTKNLPQSMGMIFMLLIFGFQTTSAVRDLISFQTGIQNTLFFSKEEMRLAEQFKGLRSAPDALTLITPKHNHWIPCLTGTPVLMGYPGWLWSWGINYAERELAVHEILLGGSRAQALIEGFALKYAVLDRNEKVGEQSVNFAFFDSHYPRLLSQGNWVIYSLESTIKSPSTSVR